MQSQSSQKSEKDQKIENYEKACSQSLFATGRGDAVEITARHLERVLKIFDDSDEDETRLEVEQPTTAYGVSNNSHQKVESSGFWLSANILNQSRSQPLNQELKAQDTKLTVSNFQAEHPKQTRNDQMAEFNEDTKNKSGDLEDLCEKLKAWNTSKRTVRVFKLPNDARGKKVTRNHKIQGEKGLLDGIFEVSTIYEEDAEDQTHTTKTKKFKSNKTLKGTHNSITLFQHFDNDTNSLPELLDPEEKENISQAFESFPLELASTKQPFEPKKSRTKRNFFDMQSKANKMNELL